MFLMGVFKALADLTEEGVLAPTKDDSWTNKWKNGDPSKGEKFPLSSTLLVWLTDRWHFYNACRTVAIFASIFLYTPLSYTYVDIAILFAAYTLGFNLTYKICK